MDKIKVMLCRGLEEAEKIQTEFPYVYDTDKNLNKLVGRMHRSILKAVEEIIPGAVGEGVKAKEG